MTSTSRRRTRLRSNQSALERWKPTPAIGVLVAGLLLGVAMGARGRVFDQSASLQEHYLLLASDLYAQGVSVAGVHDRLVRVGYSIPSVAIVGVADQLATSNDKVKQQEADQLHQFAAALAAGPDQASAVPVARADPTAIQPATATIAAAYSIADVAPVVPTVIATVADAVAIPTAMPASIPAQPVVAPPTPAVAAASGKTGVVKTANRIPVYLRKDSTTKSAVIAVVPSGTTVEIKGVVTGQAVDPAESHWYKVVTGAKSGYIYSKYVQAGG
ncbi:MAG TPA: SH3 domain-containing protein [Chloroflexota bacterium]|nr:SH3 domain-containing protein [Chloroflexota bacterium]